MFIVRPATPNDASGIARVHIESWKTTYQGIMPDSVIDNLDNTFERRKAHWEQVATDGENIIFVAEQGEDIVGFVSGGDVQDEVEGYDLELYTLYLLASAQGQGIGKALFDALAKTAHEQGYKSLILWVLDANNSKGFYEHLGGERVAEGIWQARDKQLKKLAYGWASLSALVSKKS